MNNQKIVRTFHRNDVTGHLYATIRLDSINNAMQQLSGSGFKLWMYLAKNSKDLKNWKLFSSRITELLNISRYQYNTAVSELIDKGYLVCCNNNTWDFYESGKKML